LKSKKKKNWLSGAIVGLVGLACALVLSAVFYGAMAYQLLDGAAQPVQTVSQQEAGALLAISDAELLSEQTEQTEIEGTVCTVTTREYQTADGLRVQAISASPAAYIARLSQEKWTPQLITGFTIAGMDAVYSLRGEEGLLSCREGDWICMLIAAADEQTLYALGAGAYLN